MTDQYTGEDRRHSPDIGVLIARLEVKLDALQQSLTHQRVDRDLLRGYVSRLWARDWDCTADAVYDT